MDTKQSVILQALRAGSLNRFEAERIGEHCLNTTISQLIAKGYRIVSKWETVPSRFRPVRVKRYFLIASPDKPESGGG